MRGQRQAGTHRYGGPPGTNAGGGGAFGARCRFRLDPGVPLPWISLQRMIDDPFMPALGLDALDRAAADAQVGCDPQDAAVAQGVANAVLHLASICGWAKVYLGEPEA